MQKVHSHYDNLKVSRDAPIEVIKAAYRTLSQKYHPDRNMGDDEAARVMRLLNVAYETLSDPVKRRTHDEWIRAAENGSQRETPMGESRNSPRESPKEQTSDVTAKRTRTPPPTQSEADAFLAHIASNWIWYGIGAFFLYAANSITTVNSENRSIRNASPTEFNSDIYRQLQPEGQIAGTQPHVTPSSPVLTPSSETRGNVDEPYVRPMTAPNGESWPRSAGYVKGYELLQENGLSSVTVDNSQNDSDVFVKLMDLSGEKPQPVRHFYIPSHSSFTATKVKAGRYDVRYRDLSNGGLSRSESFQLEEIEEADGIRYKNMTMTLYKVQNGNMQTFQLNESDF